MFKEVRSKSTKNNISASNSLLAENPIEAWVIHTSSLSRRGTPGTTTCLLLCQLLCLFQFKVTVYVSLMYYEYYTRLYMTMGTTTSN